MANTQRKTLLQLITLLEEQCNSHQMVNDFYYGVADLVNKFKDVKPYVVRVAPNSISYESKLTVFSLIVEVWGETEPNDSDRLVIESEAESILNDIISNFYKGLLQDEDWSIPIDTDGNITGGLISTSVVHEKEARLTGWQLQVDIQGFNTYDYCLAPFNG